MTWFTYGTPDRLCKEDLIHADKCEHVEEDMGLATKYSMESDSFGPVGIYIQCEECFEETKRQDRLNHCYYCNEEKETREWKWYDFYAPQGDEALEVCSECWDKPEHQRRIDLDIIDCREEEGHYSEQDDEFDD